MSRLKLGVIIFITFCVGFVVGVLSSNSSTNSKSTVQESAIKQEVASPTPTVSPVTETVIQKSPSPIPKVVETAKPSPIPQHAASYTTVFTFSGDGAKKSEPFTITGSKFKIKYSCSGDLCQAFLYNLGNNLPAGLIMNKVGSTTDETIFYGAGQYYIDANTMGSYTMTVEDYK